MSKKRRNRPQSVKGRGPGRNIAWNEAMREIGRSSGASPIESAKRYTRKTKHAGRQYNESL